MDNATNDKHMTSSERADLIADAHGCTITPTARPRHPAIQVQPRYSQGCPQDNDRIRACRAAISAAGISTEGWL